MKASIILLLALFPFNEIISQITLLSEHVYPIGGFSHYHGDSYDTIFDGTEAGMSGENVTWDFSDRVVNFADRGKMVAIEDAPLRDSFPLANLAEENVGFDSSFDYFHKSDSVFQKIGDYNGSANYIFYSDPRDFLRFPLSFQDSFEDEFRREEKISSDVIAGVIDYNVDGFGTLITPTGTYPDVLRVHASMDFFFIEDTDTIAINNADIYTWYDLDQGFPIATWNFFYVNNEPNASFVYLFSSSVSTSSPFAKEIDLKLSPNPTTDLLFLNYNLSESEEIRMVVYKGNGQEVKNYSYGKQNIGPQQIEIDFSTYSSGMYIVNLWVGKKIASHKVIVQD